MLVYILISGLLQMQLTVPLFLSRFSFTEVTILLVVFLMFFTMAVT